MPAAKVLIVDDDENVLSVLRQLLGVSDYNVEVAASVSEGLRRIDTDIFSIIMSDIRFPDNRTGKEILEAAKTRNKSTEVIMMTGDGSVRDAVAMMKLGAHDYITKPFDPEEILLKVRRVIDFKELSTALEQQQDSLMAIEEAAGNALGAFTGK